MPLLRKTLYFLNKKSNIFKSVETCYPYNCDLYDHSFLDIKEKFHSLFKALVSIEKHSFFREPVYSTTALAD